MSKNFPFTETGYPPPRKTETWGPPPRNLRPGTPPWKSETWDAPFPENVRHGTPPENVMTWDPPPVQAWIGYPPPPKCEQTETITFPHPSDGGR